MSAVLGHSSEQVSKPKLGVSACLMGVEVRFNGGHKESHLLTRALTEYFDFVPACPEVAIGMGIPREAIRLVGDTDHPQAVGTVHHSMDVTEQLADYGEHMAKEMSDICGYIFMQKSPSCGLERVRFTAITACRSKQVDAASMPRRSARVTLISRSKKTVV